MTPELERLVRDAAEFTAEAPPSLLDAAAPVLTDAALAAGGFYLVGLIGGKDVGKSALVNALVGQSITTSTAFGPGTETVIAYTHQKQAGAVRQLLEKQAPGQFRIVTHDVAGLSRQVLLDLPDIDSHWRSHVELTRRMLRHMLFPVWVQSVEKYADRQPQDLLGQVAVGNSAANFVFVLNKVDQLATMSGNDPDAIEELRADFAARVGRTLSTPPPRVWMVAATKPGEFDLPELRRVLSNQKSGEIVQQSQEMARKQQDRSVVMWLGTLDLPGRASRLRRLEQEATELLADRVATPLIEQSLPALTDDPSTKLALTDEVLAARVARWPIVSLVHTVLTPVMAVVRRNVGVTRSASLPDAEALVEAHLRPGGTPLATLVRSAFATLQQSNPAVSDLYRGRRLWEDMPADTAAASLRSTLTETVARHRAAVREQLTGHRSPVFAPLRWLLTIGAVVWFPFLQPIAEAVVVDQKFDWSVIHSSHELAVLVVKIFSVNALLQSLTFLGLYFFSIWVVLRWNTQKKINRLVGRWKSDTSDQSLTVQTMRWVDGLTGAIQEAREAADEIAARAAAVTDVKSAA
jgi:GTPase Era involved in 16S rRNA processing